MRAIYNGFCVTSGLGRVEMDAHDWEVSVSQLGWAVWKWMPTIGRCFCVTSGLGMVGVYENNWGRFLCDIWVGQHGNVCEKMGTFLCDIWSGQGVHGCNQIDGGFCVTPGLGQ